MAKFQVGEVVEYCGVVAAEHGKQLTVVAIRWKHKAPTQLGSIIGPHFAYTCDDGIDYAEFALRLRRPPEELGSWEQIEKLTKWNPTRVTA